ncbi:MAG: CopD family protein, partial [Campylobacterota bacterium]|nr:CopD family protein [Campylobacterota bacterium]
DGWMHAKILVVVVLMAYSFSLEYYRKKLEDNNYEKSGNFFRAYNEVPTVLSLLIVGYVITKTFSLAFTFITLAIGTFVIYRVIKQTPKEA